NKGFAEPLSAYMQYTQKDAWGNNNYDWEGSGWETYYDNLRTANLAYKRAEEMNLKFHQAVAMILKAHLFALFADSDGDIPYSQSLQGNEGLSLPQYDSQETVYKGVISDLETASQLLSNNQGNLEVFIPEQDIYFHGDS